MTDDFLRKTLRLDSLASDFCATKLKWLPPELSEKEPDYTKRVIYPQFLEFVIMLNDKRVRLNADGALSRPLPIILGDQKFYPDLSVDFEGSRTISFETKFIAESGFSGNLATAIGQGLIYKASGYKSAHVLLVSSTGHPVLGVSDLEEVNLTLSRVSVRVHQLSR